MATYNGWANYETWNVALWIGGDETFYDMAKIVTRMGHHYLGFASIMLNDFGLETTPDGVFWDDPTLDIPALDAIFVDMFNDGWSL
jgi:hypothetical protein